MHKPPPITLEDINLRRPLYGIDGRALSIARRYAPLLNERLAEDYRAYNAGLAKNPMYSATVREQGDLLADTLCGHLA